MRLFIYYIQSLLNGMNSKKDFCPKLKYINTRLFFGLTFNASPFKGLLPHFNHNLYGMYGRFPPYPRGLLYRILWKPCRLTIYRFIMRASKWRARATVQREAWRVFSGVKLLYIFIIIILRKTIRLSIIFPVRSGPMVVTV